MAPSPEKGWKYYVGLALLGFSFAVFPLAALMPFLFSVAVATPLATGMVIAGEVGFWISAAFLGKPFVEAVKAKFKSWFARPVDARPASS